MSSFKSKFILFITCIALYHAACYYLPVSLPVDYCEESNATGTCQSHVWLYVRRLNSEQTTFPYDYNYFDFCAADESQSFVENLIQVLFGEKIGLSSYDISFLKDVNCTLLCQKTYNSNFYDIAKIRTLKNGILKNYNHHWVVDNVPVSQCFEIDNTLQFCSPSFPMGCYVAPNGLPKKGCVMNTKYDPDTLYLYNHVDIQIEYQSVEQESHGMDFKANRGRILKVKVKPRSIKQQLENACSVDSLPMVIPNNLEANSFTINYTYSVKFLEDNSSNWSSRPDYLTAPFYDEQFISASCLTVLMMLLYGVVIVISHRILHIDIAHNRQAALAYTSKDQKKVGWKLVFGDVFRPPQKKMLLSVLLGSGAQVTFTALVTSIFGFLGFLCPSNERGVVTFAMVSYVCLGTSAGYVSARMYKGLGGVRWKLNGLLTSTLCSGCIFVFIFVMNLTLWAKGSINATYFAMLLALLFIWFGLSFLLTFAGAYCGFKKRAIDHPFPANKIPRQIPQQTFCNRPFFTIISGGIFPFICMYFHLFAILSTIWSNSGLYWFAILFMVFILFLTVCMETAVICCYLQLRSEDYHWWWRTFLATGFTGVYVFLYCTHFFFTKLNISDSASTFLYFGYALLIAILIFLMCGATGFFACYWCVTKIYETLKYFEAPSSTYTVFPEPIRFKKAYEDHNICKPDLKYDEYIQKSNNLKTPWCVTLYPTSTDITTSGCTAGEVKVSDSQVSAQENQK